MCGLPVANKLKRVHFQTFPPLGPGFFPKVWQVKWAEGLLLAKWYIICGRII